MVILMYLYTSASFISSTTYNFYILFKHAYTDGERGRREGWRKKKTNTIKNVKCHFCDEKQLDKIDILNFLHKLS